MSKARCRVSLLVALAVLAAMAAGCDSGSPMGQVTGKVTFNGKPLPNAEIEFQPVDNRPSSSGKTDAEGQYKLQYTAKKSGALAGEHVVRITTEQDASDDGKPAVPEKLPPKYNTKSQLKKTVEPGRQTIDFEL